MSDPQRAQPSERTHEQPREHRAQPRCWRTGPRGPGPAPAGSCCCAAPPAPAVPPCWTPPPRPPPAHGMRVLRARCSPGDDHRAVRRRPPTPRLGNGFRRGRTCGARASGSRPPCCGGCCARTPRRAAAGRRGRRPPRRRRPRTAGWSSPRGTSTDYRYVLLVVTERSQYDIDPPCRRPGPHPLARPRPHPHPRPAERGLGRRAGARSAPASPTPWVDDCVRAGAGSPLLLRALLDDLGAPGRPSGRSRQTSAALYPGAYPAAVSWWLDSAGPGTAEVARALAALDEGWDGTHARAGERPGCPAENLAGLLAGLAGADPARVAGWLTAMTGLGLLRPGPGACPHLPVCVTPCTDPRPERRDGPGEHTASATPATGARSALRAVVGRGTAGPGGRPRYAHPLLRDAVLTGCARARRQAAHRAAAEAMLRRGAPTETVARQLLLSDPVGAAWTPAVLRTPQPRRLRDGPGPRRRRLPAPGPGGTAARRTPTAAADRTGLPGVAGRQSAAGIPRLTEALQLPGAAAGPGPRGRGPGHRAGRPRRDPRRRGGAAHGRTASSTAARNWPAPCRPPSALLSDHDQTIRRGGVPMAERHRRTLARNWSAPPAGRCSYGTRPRRA